MPCTCAGSGEGKRGLDCGSQNLNDDKISQILDQFNIPQLSSFLNVVEMSDNQLSRVPIQIPLFPQLNRVVQSVVQFKVGPSTLPRPFHN